MLKFVAICCLTIFTFTPVFQAGAQWSQPETLVSGSYPLNGGRSSIKVSGNKLHLVYVEGAIGQRQIKYKRKSGNIPWQTPVTLSQTAYDAFAPRVSVSGNLVLVVYNIFYSPTQTSRAYIVRSTNGGLTWSTPQRIANDLPYNPDIAIGTDDVTYLVTGDSYLVNLYRSFDNGLNWSLLNGSVAENGGFNPRVAKDGDVLHVVYWGPAPDGDPAQPAPVWHRRSLDQGETWETPVQLNSDGNPDHLYSGHYPEMVAIGHKVHVVWLDYFNHQYDYMGDIYYARSTNDGSTWGSPVLLSTGARAITADSFGLTVDPTSRSRVYVTWSDNGNYDPLQLSGLLESNIVFRESRNYGQSWRARTTVSSGSAFAAHKFASASIYIKRTGSYKGLGIVFGEENTGGVLRLFLRRMQLATSFAY